MALKELLKQRVMERLNFSQEISDDYLKEVIQQEIVKVSKDYPMLLSDKIRLKQEVFYALRKLDILQDLLEDDTITEIMINGSENIFIEQYGKLHRYPGHFSDAEKLYQVIQQVASGANRMVNEKNPIVDARLEDGSRVNIILPPISIDGATMTIRKFAKEPMTLEWLCEREAFSEEIAQFLKILVKARYNIFISGGTGSGKTTLLNGMSNCIPKGERIITIEDSAELKLNGIENLVRLEMRNANAAGENKVDMNELIKAALRSRPDRIIVGEVRAEEALSMLNAMNTGHDGSISTGHANSSKDMLKRIETMVLMGVDMPVEAIRGQIASAIDVIIHLGRSYDGSRRLLEISEITGMTTGQIAVHQLFELDDEDQMQMKGELVNRRKLKEYGQYETYQKLMEYFKARDQPKDLITGILYIGMITWLFYNRIVCMIFLSPFLFLWMRRQRTRREYKKKEILRKEFREMMLSIGNSLSAGYSIENSLKTAKNDLLMYQENSMLAKELHLLINHLKINEPVDKLFLDMAEQVDLEELYQFAQIVSIAKRSGGNLIEITTNTIEHLSQTIQIKEEIETMTAAKQMEKRIMTMMPYFILFYVRIANPGYFDILYKSFAGMIVVTISLICLWIADSWAERVIEIEV